jgi:L-alanine-DL-glutamate epimerase-like enolase superfamily enzyme
MQIEAIAETFPLARVFTISRGSKSAAEVVTVTIRDGGHAGRGECVPYPRYGESPASVLAQIAGLPARFDHADLPDLLPAGAARNAVDCAAWDLAAKTAGCRVWDLLGQPAPAGLTTAVTISLDTPDRMRAAAAALADRPLLKIKLGTAEDMPRLQAVRAGAPGARIIVDANEGWNAATYAELAPHLLRLGVAMVEQPLPAGDDAALEGMARPVPVCADESVHDRASLAGLGRRYDAVNIKLDKAGGLTEALAMAKAARAAGLGVMVGCMVGSSLGMAPAMVVARGAGVVDLDGPLWLARDRGHPIRYHGSTMQVPDAALWG